MLVAHCLLPLTLLVLAVEVGYPYFSKFETVISSWIIIFDNKMCAH